MNKKKQKTLLARAMGVVADTASGPAQKKFLRRFFQKAATFFPACGGCSTRFAETIEGPFSR